MQRHGDWGVGHNVFQGCHRESDTGGNVVRRITFHSLRVMLAFATHEICEIFKLCRRVAWEPILIGLPGHTPPRGKLEAARGAGYLHIRFGQGAPGRSRPKF